MRGMHSLRKRKKCATPWSTGCIESGAWWTVCVKIVLIQQCWAAAKLMHCTACQESARMVSRPSISGKVMEPGAVLQMDNFYWKHTTKEVHVKGTLLVDASSRASCDSDLANCTPSGTSWTCVSVGSKTNATRIVVQVLRDVPKQSGILDKVLDVLKNAATRGRQESSRRHLLRGSVWTIVQTLITSYIRRRGYSPFQLLIGGSPTWTATGW